MANVTALIATAAYLSGVPFEGLRRRTPEAPLFSSKMGKKGTQNQAIGKHQGGLSHIAHIDIRMLSRRPNRTSEKKPRPTSRRNRHEVRGDGRLSKARGRVQILGAM
jgi:hypothetical protein